MRPPWGSVVTLILAHLLSAEPAGAQATKHNAAPIVIASKPFGESYLLAEMFAQVLEGHGIPVERLPGLGSTEITFAAVRTGSVDIYPGAPALD